MATSFIICLFEKKARLVLPFPSLAPVGRSPAAAVWIWFSCSPTRPPTRNTKACNCSQQLKPASNVRTPPSLPLDPIAIGRLILYIHVRGVYWSGQIFRRRPVQQASDFSSGMNATFLPVRSACRGVRQMTVSYWPNTFDVRFELHGKRQHNITFDVKLFSCWMHTHTHTHTYGRVEWQRAKFIQWRCGQLVRPQCMS